MVEPSQTSSRQVGPPKSTRAPLLPALCAADGVLSLAMCGYVAALPYVGYNRAMLFLIAGSLFGLMGLVVGTVGLLRKYSGWAMKLGLLASTFGLVYGSWAALQFYQQSVDRIGGGIIK